jgi:hypothetical protein
MKKLAAFTLMELLIGMIVSSLVIAFAYMAYGVLGKQFAQYRVMKAQVMNELRLTSLLDADFFKAENVMMENSALSFELPDSSSINYFFGDSIICRAQGEVKDTFRFAVKDLVGRSALDDERGVDCIGEIKFSVALPGKNTEFAFFKEYSAEQLMKFENKIKALKSERN